MGRPRIHDEATRAALLAAAGRIVAEEGPTALSLRRLADEVGASTQAIYTLFDAKPGLIRAMYREGFATLDRHLASVDHRDDARVHLRALMFAYRSSALEQPHLYDVMFACPFPEFEPSDDDEALALGTLDLLRQALRHHQQRGGLPAHDVESLAREIWGVCHGLASLELKGAFGEPEAATDIWSATVDHLLCGILDRG